MARIGRSYPSKPLLKKWSQAGRTFYFDATGGNDANSGTSAATAFQTLTKFSALLLAPQDTCLFKMGESWSGQATLARSGKDATALIRLGSYGSGARPIFTGSGAATAALYLDNASWISVTGIDITGGPYGVVSEHGSHDNTFVDMDVSGAVASGVIYTGANHTFRRVTSHDNGTDELDHGFYQSSSGGDVGSGIYEDCGAWDNASAGFHNYLTGSSTYDRCYGYHNGNWGFLNSTPTGTGRSTIYRYCLAYENGSAAFEAQGIDATGIVRWFNCTGVGSVAGFYEAGYGFYEETSTGGATIEIKNCVAAYNTAEDLKHTGVVTGNNDLLWREDGLDTLNVGGTGYTVSEFQALLPLSGHVCQNPQFINRAADNYHIQASSPARNAGVVQSPPITSDFDGDTVGSSPDIGYDETNMQVLGGTLTSTASLTPVKLGTSFTQNLTATLMSSAALVKRVSRALVGAMATSAVLVKSTGRALTGTVASSGAIVKAAAKVFTGTLTTTAVLASMKVAVKSLAGTLTSSTSLVRLTAKLAAGTLTSTAAILKQTQRAVTGALSSSGVVSRQAGHLLAATLTSLTTLASLKASFKSLAGTVTSAGTAVKLPSKSFAGTVASAGTVTQVTAKNMAAALTIGGTVVRGISKALAGVLGFVADLLTSDGTNDPFEPAMIILVRAEPHTVTVAIAPHVVSVPAEPKITVELN